MSHVKITEAERLQALADAEFKLKCDIVKARIENNYRLGVAVYEEMMNSPRIIAAQESFHVNQYLLISLSLAHAHMSLWYDMDVAQRSSNDQDCTYLQQLHRETILRQITESSNMICRIIGEINHQLNLSR